MRPLNESSPDYFKSLEERSKKSRVYRSYQMIGLQLAEILGDLPHKALYIKLAKTRDAQELLRAAKTIAENPKIQNRGAYFMRVIALARRSFSEGRNNANNNK